MLPLPAALQLGVWLGVLVGVSDPLAPGDGVCVPVSELLGKGEGMVGEEALGVAWGVPLGMAVPVGVAVPLGVAVPVGVPVSEGVPLAVTLAEEPRDAVVEGVPLLEGEG